jgi:hypothetical protein
MASGVQAVAGIEIDDDVSLVDLDHPGELSKRDLGPSQVGMFNRSTTQRIAASLFQEGATGFSWWSTLEAEWINVTLFYERALPHVRVVAPPRPLSTHDADVREAAARLDVGI